MNDSEHIRIIRKPEVLNRLGIANTTLYSRINSGLFPSPISLGGKSVGWIEHEVNTVLNSMAAGNDQEQVTALVTKLVNARKQKA